MVQNADKKRRWIPQQLSLSILYPQGGLSGLSSTNFTWLPERPQGKVTDEFLVSSENLKRRSNIKLVKYDLSVATEGEEQFIRNVPFLSKLQTSYVCPGYF